MARAKTAKRVAAAGGRVVGPLAGVVSLGTSDIAQYACDLCLARGGQHGHDEEVWLQAELERQAESATS